MAPTPGGPAAGWGRQGHGRSPLLVAARTDDLDAMERYLRRQLRRGELNLTALRDHYGLRPPRGLVAMPQLDNSEHTLSSYDELLVGTPEQACAGIGSASGVETVETAPVPHHFRRA